ncbi:palmitoyltransferase pfa5 [Conoideocrella luteorostrata]|uniref:Palmitoyltransferase n=1 Tax=Conoideocrella luteorostrata TaxID=1105319 RepID=A0AAJ0CPV4_9HYPO|nr:palmitoyltransferase pfa5 [Conoideocrella luteorostrata]
MLALFCCLFILAFGSYIRLVLAIKRDPGLVPLLRERDPETAEIAEKRRKSRSGRNREPGNLPWVPPDTDPNSPGLEAFYSKDVFVCEWDGRPKWCSECCQWKPERAHHSSDLGRCVRKMDHLCPWVGGMVSETSFNFFTQFTFWTTFLCVLCVAVSAYSLQQQIAEGVQADGWIIAVIAISSFFGFFAFGMILTGVPFLYHNTTNIDALKKSQIFLLAVRIPRDTPPSSQYPTITYPLPLTQHTAAGTDDQQEQGTADDVRARDMQAIRKFAILQTEAGENPWDLGPWENFKSVMGTSVAEWLLPIRHSPCCRHDSMVSDYPYGSLVEELRKRYGVPHLNEKTPNGAEMHNLAANGN